MQTLLVVVTFAAVGSAVVAFLGPGIFWPFAIVTLGVVSLAEVICFGTLAIYCRGYRQTFFLGAFVGSLSVVRTISGASFTNWLELALFIGGNLINVLGAGWLALVTRRFAERRGWHRPDNDVR